MEFFSFYFLLGIVVGEIRGFRLCGFWELERLPVLVNIGFPVPFGHAMFWDRARPRQGVRNDGMWSVGKRWLPHLRTLYHLPDLARWFMNGIDDKPQGAFGPWRITNGWSVVDANVHIECLLNKGKHISKVKDIKARIKSRPIPSHARFDPSLFNWYLTGVESLAIDMNVDRKAFEERVSRMYRRGDSLELVRLQAAKSLTMMARGQVYHLEVDADDLEIPNLDRDLKKHNKRIEVCDWRLLTSYGEYADRSEWGGLCLAKIYWPHEETFIFAKGEYTLRISEGEVQEIRARFNRDLGEEEMELVRDDFPKIIAALEGVSSPLSQNAQDMWAAHGFARTDALRLEGEVQPGEEAWYDFE